MGSVQQVQCPITPTEPDLVIVSDANKLIEHFELACYRVTDELIKGAQERKLRRHVIDTFETETAKTRTKAIRSRVNCRVLKCVPCETFRVTQESSTYHVFDVSQI